MATPQKKQCISDTNKTKGLIFLFLLIYFCSCSRYHHLPRTNVKEKAVSTNISKNKHNDPIKEVVEEPLNVSERLGDISHSIQMQNNRIQLETSKNKFTLKKTFIKHLLVKTGFKEDHGNVLTNHLSVNAKREMLGVKSAVNNSDDIGDLIIYLLIAIIAFLIYNIKVFIAFINDTFWAVLEKIKERNENKKDKTGRIFTYLLFSNLFVWIASKIKFD